MKPSEALRIARQNLMRGDYIGAVLPRNDAGSDIVKDYIDKSLCSATYGEWVRRNHPDVFYNPYFNIHEGRLQWIDWMINEYEKIGQ